MDVLERVILKLKWRRPEIPLWARAERMEMSVPEAVLWRSGRQFSDAEEDEHKKAQGR